MDPENAGLDDDDDIPLEPPVKKSRTDVTELPENLSCDATENTGKVSPETLQKKHETKEAEILQRNHETKKSSLTDKEIYENDLPLLANVDQVHISHYVLSLNVSVDTETIEGTVILFPHKVKEDDEDVTEIILDSCMLKVCKVQAVNTTVAEDPLKALESINREEAIEDVKFEVDKWSLRIHGWTGRFPQAIRVFYETLPESPSLHWRPIEGFDVDENVPLCCYTPAAPVNNRALFPCQEPPSAMATWQCFVKFKKPYVAFLSSDKAGRILSEDDSSTVAYFNCSEVLPMSTFAIFVTTLNMENILEDEQVRSDVAVRIIFQEDRWVTMARVLQEFVQCVLQVTDRILGKLPFDRLDVMIMPRSFPILGLANPNMIFLSPSLLDGEKPLLFIRTAHEIAHFWFGLSIGALDWTEEWLSEGFATFFEDIFLRETLRDGNFNHHNTPSIEEVNLRSCIRLIALQSELENTSDSDLHILVHDDAAKPLHAVKNGLEPMKQVLQVHYLKGYFYLKSLSDLVTEHRFLTYLRHYTWTFKGKLVTSNDFTTCFKQAFCPELLNPDQVDSLTHSWLQKAQLPQTHTILNLTIPTMITPSSVQLLFPDCSSTLAKVSCLVFAFLSTPLQQQQQLEMNPSEKILFLEQISTASPHLTPSQVDSLEKIMKPRENLEVFHRWCELLVKYRCFSRINSVREFLVGHPAMGIYLYGELMISEKPKFQRLARNVFQVMQRVIDPPLLPILRAMIH